MVRVMVKEVGDQKQLNFDGDFEEPPVKEAAPEVELAGVVSSDEAATDE